MMAVERKGARSHYSRPATRRGSVFSNEKASSPIIYCLFKSSQMALIFLSPHVSLLALQKATLH